MKKIIVRIKTDLGERSYKAIKSRKASWKERNISNKIFKEKIIQECPTIVEITCKIEWLAVQVDITGQIEEGMGKFECKKGIDYDIEVL